MLKLSRWIIYLRLLSSAMARAVETSISISGTDAGRVFEGIGAVFHMRFGAEPCDCEGREGSPQAVRIRVLADERSPEAEP